MHARTTSVAGATAGPEALPARAEKGHVAVAIGPADRRISRPLTVKNNAALIGTLFTGIRSIAIGTPVA
ncbi:hypothetical protein [Streptomyces sp. NPDC002205]|uniref:hypothetical protein n=1 Tax=Streptomyces sp. NPDC002205 TaxID=3154411 RepID=UPI0033328B10